MEAMTSRTKRSQYFIELRMDSNNQIFSNRRNMPGATKRSNSVDKKIESVSLVDEIDGIMLRIESIKDSANDSGIYQEILSLRKLLLSLDSKSIEIVVSHMHKKEYCKTLTNLLKRKMHMENTDDILEEITHLFITLLSTTYLETLNSIVSDSLIVLYEKLLDTKNCKLLEYILLGLSNIVSSNEFMKNYFKDIGLISRVTQVIEYWIMHNQVSENLLSSYCKFTDQYFATRPLLSYVEMKNYVEFFFRLYTTLHRSVYSEFEIDILDFLCISTSLAENSEIDDLSGIVGWCEFLRRMVSNLADDNIEVAQLSIKILANLTYSDSEQIFQEFLHTPLFDNCYHLLSIGDQETCKDTLIFISNVLVFRGEYINMFCKDERILRFLLGHTMDPDIYEKMKSELLGVFRNLFTISDHGVLSEFISNNPEVIQVFIEKVYTNETPTYLVTLYYIIKGLFEIGNYIKVKTDEETNIIVEYVIVDETLYTRLEDIQRHAESRVAKFYANLVHTYLSDGAEDD